MIFAIGNAHPSNVWPFNLNTHVTRANITYTFLANPTTGVPTTAIPTTAVPTTGVPTTAAPTTAIPTTATTTGWPFTAPPTTTYVSSHNNIIIGVMAGVVGVAAILFVAWAAANSCSNPQYKRVKFNTS